MPNPIRIKISQNVQYTFETHASNTQHVRFSSKTAKPQTRTGSGDSLSGPFGLDAGTWEITHNSSPNGKEPWTKGRGRVRDKQVVEFDDHPTGGDNDFNDVQIVFFESFDVLNDQ